MRPVLCLTLLLAAFSPSGFGQSDLPNPTPVPAPEATKPGPAEQMIYATHLQAPVVISPSRETGREQLWLFRGNAWELDSAQGPPAREIAAVTYDTIRNKIILHGGMGLNDRENRFGDTWEWDGTKWHQAADNSIGPRDHHAMAFDSARGVAVLYGGVKSGEELDPSTWEWNGTTWKRAASEGPGGRAHTAMVFDSTRNQTILYGGLGENYSKPNETWAWDGVQWKQLTADGPPPRTHHRMAFDAERGVTVLFGGLNNGNFRQALADTWTFDGKKWTEAKPANAPAARSGHVMTYDITRNRVLLYGGGSFDGTKSNSYRDLWEWDGNNWKQIN